MYNSPIFFKTLLFTSLIAITACSDQADVSERAKAPVQVTTNTQAQPAAAPAQASTPTAKTGIVKSAQVAGAYSYLETDINGSTFWIATAASAVKPGQKISWNDYAMMNNFTSKAMGRTFDQIMFVDRINAGEPSASANQNTGKVLETMSAAGYSYMLVSGKSGKQTWLAAPQMVINVGQNISWSGGSAMHNFSSRSLNRTFDEILFVNAVQLTNG